MEWRGREKDKIKVGGEKRRIKLNGRSLGDKGRLVTRCDDGRVNGRPFPPSQTNFLDAATVPCYGTTL